VARWLDDVAYHIPGAVRIALQRNPYFVDSPVDSHWYPAGAETFAAILVLASGSINSTNATGAICFAGLCLLVYFFAGLWTSDRVGRLSSVLCLASIPLLLAQCLAFYVDIHFTFVVLASLYLQCLALQRRRAQYAWGALAAAVSAASLKYAGLAALLVLATGCFACVALARPPRRPGWRVSLLLAATIAFTSGFYARNWSARGNPLYPVPLPAWLRPVAATIGTVYEEDPDLLAAAQGSRQVSSFPHPWIPASWPRVALKPDMTDDGFGAAGSLALLGTAVSLLFLPRLGGGARRAWILVVAESVLLVGLFPGLASTPRYVLFLPAVASLSPAVLTAMTRSRLSRAAVDAFHLLIVVASAVYCWANLLGPGGEWTSVREAAALLVPYRPDGRRAIPYAQAGHLRIGYTSGFNNMIALLYDRDLSNELVPLHFRNYPFNHGRQIATEEDFIAYVRSLDLDYIQIFDPRYPGAELLRRHFPDKVWLWQGSGVARP
jgi:hypothetical protein